MENAINFGLHDDGVSIVAIIETPAGDVWQTFTLDKPVPLDTDPAELFDTASGDEPTQRCAALMSDTAKKLGVCVVFTCAKCSDMTARTLDRSELTYLSGNQINRQVLCSRCMIAKSDYFVPCAVPRSAITITLRVPI